jgi:hypothetical protein
VVEATTSIVKDSNGNSKTNGWLADYATIESTKDTQEQESNPST